MTDGQLGNYTFLPWLRRGVAAALPTTDPLDSSAPSRAVLAVELELNGTLVPIQTRVYGPADVVGLDARLVVRRTPERDAVDVSPNCFAAVDFARDDLPWLFTPLKADTAGRLRPWMVLVVVREQPGVRLLPPGAGPLPVLEIDAPAVAKDELPDLAESWAWAHVQVSGTPPQGTTFVQYVEAHPHLAVSRLLCPQRLLPNSRYFACLVPAFLPGLKAGLGVTAGLEPDAELSPAWDLATLPTRVHLPVYSHWQFGTGDRADFEALARALKPRVVGPEVGQFPVDVGEPGPGLPSIAAEDPGRVLTFEGALRSTDSQITTWPDTARVPFEGAARTLLDAPFEAPTDPIIGPVLAPPLYGSWHAAQERVPQAEPHWLRELNLDPRYRSAAGLGTMVVQKEQEALMEEAWLQLGDLALANKELNRAQFARAVTAGIKQKHLDPLVSAQLLQMTRSLHRRVTLSPQTVFAATRGSLLEGSVLSGSFRRLARPRGPLAKRQGRRDWPSVVDKINAAEIVAAPPRSAPSGGARLDLVAGSPLDATNPTSSTGRARAVRLALIALVLILLAVWALSQGAGALAVGLLFLGLALAVGALRAGQGKTAEPLPDPSDPDSNEPGDQLVGRHLTAAGVRTAPPRPGFKLLTNPEEVGTVAAASEQPGATRDNAEARAFRTAAAAVLARIDGVTKARSTVKPHALDLPTVRLRLLERLDPETTILARVKSRIAIPPELQVPADPLAPVMAYPEFPRPMYEALAELSAAYVLPGLEHVPPDTVTLLETNPTMVQAFMTGLNHEMARELLWREYPTDQRGSYFRQFWDPHGRLPVPADPRELLDVPELHTFRPEEHLGQSLSGTASTPQLVLLVRGELLRRFPTAMVFAERAHLNPVTGQFEPNGEMRFPLFQGQLQPDVRFLGFDLTEEVARGNDDAATPGWYFVIQEQPTEPRFGLDEATAFADELAPVSDWDNLSWGHLANRADFERLTFVSVTGELPKTQFSASEQAIWGSNAAHMAYITLQKPVRIAIHARVMLPKRAGEAPHG